MIKLTKRVETILSQKTVNKEKNDYHIFGRTLPGNPPVLLGQQYKFGKAEAVKLTRHIVTEFEVPAQKRILKEIHARSSTHFIAKGSIALTRDGAAALTRLAKELGLAITFASGQPKPIHPVG